MTKRQRRAYWRARVQWRGRQAAGPYWGSPGALRQSAALWLNAAAAKRRATVGAVPLAALHPSWACARFAGECAHQLRARCGAGVGLPS
jgi:hypothetical protein